jgi:hypothetical protein
MAHYSQPLDTKRKEIRRLVLQPLTAGLALQCSAETVSLFEQPEYEALSYVWGDPSSSRSIDFDGTPCSVTKNLAIALDYLRLNDKPRRLWIDALCINQRITKERNEQVGLMGEIYAKASLVLVWLGEASEGSDDAFTLISKIAEGKALMVDTSRKLFAFYLMLIQKEWFTRLWTVQELALASRDPLVGCGTKWISWSTLSRVWKQVALREFTEMGMVIKEKRSEAGVEDEDDFKSGVRPGGIKIDLLNNLRTGVIMKGGESLRNLLLNTNSSNVTEPRDRIYALLGMMNQEHRVFINVDYDRPVGKVYAEAVAHIFQTENGPWLLSGMELAGDSLNASFPSWVPMFGSKTLLSPTLLHPSGIGASGAGSNCINGIVDQDLTTLRVRGLPIDTITEKISFGDNQDCLKQLPHVEALANIALQLAASNSKNRPYLNEFKTKEPVWRTLIANKAYGGAAREPAPESYRDMYQILLRNDSSDGSGSKSEDEFVRDYRLSLLNRLPRGCFFITETGFCGICQCLIERGDQLAIWFGSPAPFVLKRNLQACDEQGRSIFSVRGVAYVAGIMGGEMVDQVYCEELEDDIVFVVQ